MIPVDEALRGVRDAEPVEATVRVDPERAAGRVLAGDVEARRPSPPFDRAAMDGYAVRSGDLEGASHRDPVSLQVAGEMAAGSGREAGEATPNPRRALRIFTGAPVPRKADAVVRQEDVTERGGEVEFRAGVPPGTNIRRAGEEVGAGDILLPAGTVLGPAASGLLRAQGIDEVEVVRRPRVAVLPTGDELLPAGTEPGPGEVVDTVSPILSLALRGMGFDPTVRRCGDHPGELRALLEGLLERHDVVFSVGGISVGDRDFVRPVLSALGVSERFAGVAQKPGKPLYHGRLGGRAVLGLPGNPVSAAVCFYVYGVPLLRRIAGYPDGQLELPSVPVEVDTEERRRHEREDRTVFVRARTERTESGHRSRPADRQGSHMLTGLAGADSLVRLPPARDGERGPCRAYLLPQPAFPASPGRPCPTPRRSAARGSTGR